MSLGDKIVQLSFQIYLSTIEIWAQLINLFKPQLFHLYNRSYRLD